MRRCLVRVSAVGAFQAAGRSWASRAIFATDQIERSTNDIIAAAERDLDAARRSAKSVLPKPLAPKIVEIHR